MRASALGLPHTWSPPPSQPGNGQQREHDVHRARGRRGGGGGGGQGGKGAEQGEGRGAWRRRAGHHESLLTMQPSCLSHSTGIVMRHVPSGSDAWYASCRKNGPSRPAHGGQLVPPRSAQPRSLWPSATSMETAPCSRTRRRSVLKKCTWCACAVHSVCLRCARGVHAACTRRARGVHAACLQPHEVTRAAGARGPGADAGDEEVVAPRLRHVLGAGGARRLDDASELRRRPREVGAARSQQPVAHQPAVDQRVPRELGVAGAWVVGRRLLRARRRQPAHAVLVVGAQRLGESAVAAPLVEDTVNAGPVLRAEVIPAPGRGRTRGWDSGRGPGFGAGAQGEGLGLGLRVRLGAGAQGQG